MTNQTHETQQELTLEEYRDCFSDFHKDAYGFRPRFSTSHWTIQDFRNKFDKLGRICEENRIQEEAAEAKAVVKFEADVAKLLTMGAKDRATAIKWIAEANNADNTSLDYLCFKLGLPYRYFEKEGTQNVQTGLVAGEQGMGLGST